MERREKAPAEAFVAASFRPWGREGSFPRQVVWKDCVSQKDMSVLTKILLLRGAVHFLSR